MDLNKIVLAVQGVLADKILIIALVGTGLWFTFNLGFIQIRGFGEGWKRTFGGLFKKSGKAGKDGMAFTHQSIIFHFQFSINKTVPFNAFRSEERRVGKECRSRWSPYH